MFFPSLSSVSKYLCQILGEHAPGPHAVVLSPSGGGTFVTATIHECPPPAHRGSVAASLSSVHECTVLESISADTPSSTQLLSGRRATRRRYVLLSYRLAVRRRSHRKRRGTFLSSPTISLYSRFLVLITSYPDRLCHDTK